MFSAGIFGVAGAFLKQTAWV